MGHNTQQLEPWDVGELIPHAHSTCTFPPRAIRSTTPSTPCTMLVRCQMRSWSPRPASSAMGMAPSACSVATTTTRGKLATWCTRPPTKSGSALDKVTQNMQQAESVVHLDLAMYLVIT